jgi:glycosyltransferase involved in cell wall biosynthesis
MKILLIGSGKSFHATRWANALNKRGLKVAFATVHKVSRPIDKGIEIFQLSTHGGIGYILDVPKLKKVINEWEPDIVHAHFSTGYGLMSKLCGFKIRIISIYGTDIYDFPKKSFLHKTLLNYNLSDCSTILSTSENMADEYLKTYPKHRRPTVTPFGVDINVFKPSNLIHDKSVINIGIVKKMEDKYGIDILLKAFAQLNKNIKNIDLKLHIVGNGSKINKLKKLSEALKIDKKVKFYGWMKNSEVPAFLNKLDIYIVPSRSESFGVAAVEAQSCGLPVIVSNVGGLPEVVKANETGIVVEKENISELADAMKLLCEDSSYREELGLNAIKRVHKLYDWEKNVDLMISIYKKVLNNDEK